MRQRTCTVTATVHVKVRTLKALRLAFPFCARFVDTLRQMYKPGEIVWDQAAVHADPATGEPRKGAWYVTDQMDRRRALAELIRKHFPTAHYVSGDGAVRPLEAMVPAPAVLTAFAQFLERRVEERAAAGGGTGG